MLLSEFDYDLPEELIAQEPVEPRDHSRLMVVNHQTGEICHDRFFNLPVYLRPDDLVVFNQTMVFPARIYGHKETGGRVEVLLLRNSPPWKFISKPSLKDGQRVVFNSVLEAIVRNGQLVFNVDLDDVMPILADIGYTPLPPYINARGQVSSAKQMRSRYQTVYAKDVGSVAAPTAGFHFTNELLEKIPNKAFVTLHVGLGTFVPVKTENIEDHTMHTEQFSVPANLRSQIAYHKRTIAVGTTTARVLESDWTKPDTNIFIYPGYKFKHVDALITNFHLPKSTLLMLVSAFAGRELIMHAYQEAIAKKYRFYSFGDAMLIL